MIFGSLARTPLSNETKFLYWKQKILYYQFIFIFLLCWYLKYSEDMKNKNRLSQRKISYQKFSSEAQRHLCFVRTLWHTIKAPFIWENEGFTSRGRWIRMAHLLQKSPWRSIVWFTGQMWFCLSVSWKSPRMSLKSPPCAAWSSIVALPKWKVFSWTSKMAICGDFPLVYRLLLLDLPLSFQLQKFAHLFFELHEFSRPNQISQDPSRPKQSIER